MTSSTIPLGAPKSDTYYSLPRADLIELLPRPPGRVLDVGCGEGSANEPLRAAGASRISGIELLPEPAARARERYDEVAVGDALEVVDQLDAPFDTTLCYDVLEHLIDPAALLRRLLETSAPGGRLHVSVPNASHVSLLRDLIVRGTFGYAPYGHRDATHLRWFTRKDIVALVGECGWQVVSTAHSPLHRSKGLARLTRGRATEYLAGQWYVLARAPRA
jgi:2-polyprenyl-3-methyl-5-hydroxy-6-metoxy-1,4-benzoquinol methylase